jgi:hypothetical protein
MDLTTFQTELSSQHYLATPETKSIQQNQSSITENKSVEVSRTKPTFENLMARIQEASLEPSEDIIPRNLDSAEFEKALLQLPTLLKQDQVKAQRLIKDLVASAKALTHDTASSLSAVPIHPYEKLIYDYLGPNFIAPTIDQYLVPSNFSPVVSVRELEKISRKTSVIEMSQYACMSAEAMNLSFDGTFTTENLNNAFAVPSVDSEGNQTFVIDKERLAELERLAARGALGLSTAEEQLLQNQLLSPAQALARQQMIEQRSLTSATGGGAGQDFAAMLNRQEAEQRRIADAQAKIAEADLIRAQAQEEEMRKLAAAGDEARAKRISAIFGGAADIGAELFGIQRERKRAEEITGAGAVDNRYETDYLK